MTLLVDHGLNDDGSDVVYVMTVDGALVAELSPDEASVLAEDLLSNVLAVEVSNT